MEKIAFKGIFTDEIREVFKKRREACHISYHKLAALLNTSWLTISNWENGRTHKCHQSFIGKVSMFLNGELDIDAKLASGKFHKSLMQQQATVASNTQNILFKIRHTYNFCAGSESIRNQLVRRIIEESRKTLLQYISTIREKA
ncbi:MAG: hypothetical protein IJS15_13435 [Victivallales bacterium]|nr:hypothetical protein [Victivallales bacterium]